MAHRIAVLPGDGIGPEIAAPAMDVLSRLGDFEFSVLPFGGFQLGLLVRRKRFEHECSPLLHRLAAMQAALEDRSE